MRMSLDLSEVPGFAVNLALPGEDLICLVTHSKRKMVRYARDQFTVSQFWNEAEVSILYRKGGAVAVGSTLNLSKDAVQNAVNGLRKSAGAIPKRPLAPSLPPKTAYVPVEDAYDQNCLADDDMMAGLVLEGDEAAKKSGADRTAVVLNAEEVEWFLSSTTGASGAAKSTSAHMVIRAFKESGSGQGITASPYMSKLDPKGAGNKAGELAFDAKQPEKGEEGRYNVVLDPSVFANLLNAVGFAASAYAVEAGFSFLEGKLGHDVASRTFSLYDEGRQKAGLLVRPFDDEGFPTSRTAIIEKGTIKNYLTNSYFSAKMGLPDTGNAGWIEPRPWNLYVPGGDSSEQDLFSDHVIYITNNWYTRFQNYVTGDFSTILRDAVFEIREGKRVKAIKGLRMSDSLIRMLSSIAALSSKPHLIKWWEVETPTSTPFVLIRDVHLTVAE